jgi:SAM-dependent methyltransferase
MTQIRRANLGQRDYWTGDGVHVWQEHGQWWEKIFAPFGVAMFERAQLQPGQRVLDVGCGWGAATMAAAERVAPGGLAVGLDFSPQMLAVARQRATRSDNIAWLEADAQVHPFEPGTYDAVISRFATMLVDDPRAAFANLHRALRPGGRMAFVCWQEPMKSEWIAVSMAAAVPVVGRPPELGGEDEPGPFAFADGERVRGLVAAAGFGDVALETVTRPLPIGTDLEDAVGAVMALPETRQMLADTPDGTAAATASALREAFTPYAGTHGVVMDGSAWLVSARA